MKIDKNNLEKVIGEMIDENKDLAIEIIKWFILEDKNTRPNQEIRKDLVKALTPKLKPVNMSVFVNSPIDCVFSDDNPLVIGSASRIGNLEKILNNRSFYFGSDYDYYTYCTPRIDYWFSVNLFRTIDECYIFINNLENAGFDVDADYFDGYLRAFKIIGLKDGYCWTWECENDQPHLDVDYSKGGEK